MVRKTYPFDSARYIIDREAETELLQDALDSGDSLHLTHVLDLIARARGMTNLAGDLGIPRDALFDALREAEDGPAALRNLVEAYLAGAKVEHAPAE